MKKLFAILIITLTIISSVAYAAVIPTEVELNKNLTITFNGQMQKFKNVKGDRVFPISYQGTTYLPIRSISCLFETEIMWDGNTNSIYLGKGELDKIAAESTNTKLITDNEYITVELNQDIKIYHNNQVQTFRDVTGKVVYPLSYNGTTYLPVRAISNLYNAGIEWDGETSTVVITKTNSETELPDNGSVTAKFDISGYASWNGNTSFSVYIDGEYVRVDANKFKLPSILKNYSENVQLEITYFIHSKEVLICSVINKSTGEKISDLSEENIKKLFDIEYGKTPINKPWCEEIKLSEITPNTIYKYTATSTVQIPKITNDTGKDCVVYTKETKEGGWNDESYEKEVYLLNNIEGNAASFVYNEFIAGESLNIMYKEATTNELLSIIDSDEIIRLNGYKSGQSLQYGFEDYIYNDTANDITLITKDSAFGMEETKTIVIKAGKIYGFSWMIDSVTVK